MSKIVVKGGLTGAKARIKTLETENSALQKLVKQKCAENENLLRQCESHINAVTAAGKEALLKAVQSVKDLKSVNAELRDATEEIQKQRDKLRYDRNTYRAAFWILFALAATSAIVDALFYWSVLS